jgi:hypothetical protein
MLRVKFGVDSTVNDSNSSFSRRFPTDWSMCACVHVCACVCVCVCGCVHVYA